MIRTIACDPGIKAFGVMDNNRLVYVHKDGAGWLVLKCILYSSSGFSLLDIGVFIQIHR